MRDIYDISLYFKVISKCIMAAQKWGKKIGKIFLHFWIIFEYLLLSALLILVEDYRPYRRL